MEYIAITNARVLFGKETPPSGYMRATTYDGKIGWLRHLPVTGVFLFQPVESFPNGVGIGALRKMYC